MEIRSESPTPKFWTKCKMSFGVKRPLKGGRKNKLKANFGEREREREREGERTTKPYLILELQHFEQQWKKVVHFISHGIQNFLSLFDFFFFFKMVLKCSHFGVSQTCLESATPDFMGFNVWLFCYSIGDVASRCGSDASLPRQYV